MTYFEKIKKTLIDEINNMTFRDAPRMVDCDVCPLYKKCLEDENSIDSGGCIYMWRKYGEDECEDD